MLKVFDKSDPFGPFPSTVYRSLALGGAEIYPQVCHLYRPGFPFLLLDMSISCLCQHVFVVENFMFSHSHICAIKKKRKNLKPLV